MPAATCKVELLSVSKKEYDKLARLPSQVEAGTASVKDDDDTPMALPGGKYIRARLRS